MRNRALVLGVATLSMAVLLAAAVPASERSGPAGAGPVCTINGTPDDDHIRGTNRRDVICAGRGDDFVESRGGNDVVFAGPGNDLVDAGRGSDLVYGGGGYDIIFGQEGNDELFGQAGRDDVRGDRGRDRIHGGGGGDYCLSAIDGRPGDEVDGGPGMDTGDSDPGDIVRSVENLYDFYCFGE